MDEVENPALPAAGEASPTLRPVDQDGTPLADAPECGPALPIDTAEAIALAENGDANARPVLPTGPRPPTATGRPGLTREGSIPAPQQPPPAPPSQTAAIDFSQEAPDSLTLADLKRIRSTFPTAVLPPKKELLENDRIYDFDYRDAQSFPVELEEWFSYSEDEENKLRRCKAAFQEEWWATEGGRLDWLEAPEAARETFVKRWVDVLRNGQQEQQAQVTKALMLLAYVALGVWEETGGRHEGPSLEDIFPDSKFGGSRLEEYGRSSLQVKWIVSTVETLHSLDGLKAIYETLRRVCDREFEDVPLEPPSRNESQPRRGDEGIDLWCCLTLTYLFVEISRTAGNGQALTKDVLALEPNLLNHLTQIVARLRWDEYAPIPLSKMLLLAWKTILVSFGGLQDVENVKASFREDQDETDARGKPIITASPLDYHLFRQEISSKYPAYQPPPPLFALEPENNSILPPLSHRRPSYAASDTTHTGAPSVITGSIMHQPIHIATPAPSPPPSPAGPGKAGKKQNYQTNQMFPFLYPPLDASSNDLGGKGSTELQDALVGRRWEGSDVPTSILEAAELFAKRMRATRAMKQLWEARVDYMKQERGWKDPENGNKLPEVDDFKLVPEMAPEETVEQGKPIPQTDEQRRLTRVGEYYRDSLPHLQSVVIVLLKAVLQSVTDLVTKGNGQNGLQAGIQFNEPNGMNGNKPMENGVNHADGLENTAEELDRLRTQEVTAKALTAIILLLLKWFKVSHVLQYEYLTQLLLDSNYVPLMLKIWHAQDIGRACHFRLEREERNFFSLCQADSRQAGRRRSQGDVDSSIATHSRNISHSDSDDAAPPPIKLKRPDPANDPSSPYPDQPPTDFIHPPEVDELGYATTPLPHSPLKNYSYRTLFTSLNHLRVLQKITRRKTHRALHLVSYKSSAHLKKSLRIPVPLLRYYTLKLFKSQVPFCGRKWRQGNMKIITAVWLSVPAELRDDWLTGGGGGMGGSGGLGDVDGSVEDAVPLEQAMRSLTFWWNLRSFPEAMGVMEWDDKEPEEGGFFARELERMNFEAEGEAALGLGIEGDMGMMQMQGEAWRGGGGVEGY